MVVGLGYLTYWRDLSACTDTSTAVMDNLHGFAMEGCYIEGLVKREDKSRWSPMRKQGIVVCLRENKQE